jgi:hypothetical protein
MWFSSSLVLADGKATCIARRAIANPLRAVADAHSSRTAAQKVPVLASFSRTI